MDIFEASQSGNIETLQKLLKEGIQPYIKDNLYDTTALMKASGNGHVFCVEALLQAGADPNIKDNGGWTALMIASYRGHISCVEALLRAGTNPNIKDDRRKTAYMLTTNQNIKTIIREYENIWSLIPMYIASSKNKLGLPIELVDKISKML